MFSVLRCALPGDATLVLRHTPGHASATVCVQAPFGTVESQRPMFETPVPRMSMEAVALDDDRVWLELRWNR
jgi:hypothetical protein